MPEEGKSLLSKRKLQPAQGLAVTEKIKQMCEKKDRAYVIAMTSNKTGTGFHS